MNHSVSQAVSQAACLSKPIQADNPPQKLSETGLFEDLTALKPCSQLIFYAINQPFWSDGAIKVRWVILPGKIEFAAEAPWKFPVGTILVKHFELEGRNQKKIRIETRLLMNLEEDDWYGYTYQWQDDQKDALLLDEATTKEYLVFDPVLGVRKQLWNFPSRRTCLQCHNSWSNYVLGPRTEQINLVLPEGHTNQLDEWNQKDYFTSKIENSSHYKSYAKISDFAQSLEKRARSYLAINCSQCHQPQSPVRTKIDLRFRTPLNETHLVNEKPNAGDMDLPGALLIRPGRKEESVLWKRIATKTTLRMPPTAGDEMDQTGISLIGEWIDSLSPNSLPLSTLPKSKSSN